jgi:DNA-binding IscR family transcriptional regulator
VTYVTQHMAGLEMKEVARSRRGGMMLDRGWLFRVAAAYATSFTRGEGPIAPHALADRHRLPHDTIAALADHLVGHGILVPVEGRRHETHYQLNLPPDRIPLARLASVADELDPGYARAGVDTPVERLIVELARNRDAALEGRTLADLVE